MGALTKGQVSVKPVRASMRGSLTDLSSQAGRIFRYGQVRPGEAGWGNINDDPEPLGKPGQNVTSPGRPAVMPAEDGLPERFVGRLYWTALDRRAMSILGTDATDSRTQVLHCADVLISRGILDNEMNIFISTRNDDQLRAYAYPAITDLLTSVDAGASLRSSESALDTGGADFFRWLVFHALEQDELAGGLRISEMHTLSGLDTSDRGTAFKHGIQVDRPELVAMLASHRNTMGPAKITVANSLLQLDADFELFDDGTFVPVLGDSFYEHGPRDRPTHGFRLVNDLAYHVIPGLISAFGSDKNWAARDRDAFQRTIREALNVYVQGVNKAIGP